MLKAHSCSINCYRVHNTIHKDPGSSATIRISPNGLPPKPPPAAFTNPSSSHIKSGDPSLASTSHVSLVPSTELSRLYLQYPKLRNQLREIYEATTEPLDDHLDDSPRSAERRDRGRGKGRGSRHERGRGRGRGPIQSAPWSQQRGFKAGLHLLRKLRHLKGNDGEGLKVFSKLVAIRVEAKISGPAATSV